MQGSEGNAEKTEPSGWLTCYLKLVLSLPPLCPPFQHHLPEVCYIGVIVWRRTFYPCFPLRHKPSQLEEELHRADEALAQGWCYPARNFFLNPSLRGRVACSSYDLIVLYIKTACSTTSAFWGHFGTGKKKPVNNLLIWFIPLIKKNKRMANSRKIKQSFSYSTVLVWVFLQMEGLRIFIRCNIDIIMSSCKQCTSEKLPCWLSQLLFYEAICLLLILISFQTCMIYFNLWNIKDIFRIFEKRCIKEVSGH